jgi:hypothetical protein
MECIRSRRLLLSLLFPVCLLPAVARADDPPARADFKIVVWYHRDRPLDTFKYQVYDLRKGEYTRAVDDWLLLMKTRYPGYVVHVRDVELAREKGATETMRVGSVIHRELLAAAAMEGIFLGDSLPRVVSPRPGARMPPTPRFPGASSFPSIGASGAVDLNPPRPSFPVPVPFPRPHP